MFSPDDSTTVRPVGTFGTVGTARTARTVRPTRYGALLLGLALVIAACDGAPPVHDSPLVELQKLVGDNDHIHIDEVRYRADDQMLVHCGYDFGVVDASDPAAMRYRVERIRHEIPGDSRTPGCIHLAIDGDVVYTTHRGNIDNPAFLSGWELREDPDDPTRLAPIQLPVLQEPGVSYEGVDVENGRIFVALRTGGLGIYERDDSDGFRRIGTAEEVGNAWGVRVRDGIAFVSDGLDGVAIFDVGDPGSPRLLGRAAVGGQARGMALDGDHLLVAAGSQGLVIVDVSDPENPREVGRGGPVPGTAIRVDVAGDHAYLAAWTDARAYDISDPAAPRFIGSTRLTRDIGFDDERRAPVTSRTLGIAAAGETMLLGNWHVVHSYRMHPERTAPNVVLPEAINLLDFGSLGEGETGRVTIAVGNQGTAPLVLRDIRTDHEAFVVTPTHLEIEAGGSAMVEVAYESSDPEPTSAIIEFESNDPLQPVRTGYMTANWPGLGVGDPLPDFEVSLVDGGHWSSSDAAGEVMLLAYFSTFCPVCSIELPELEDRFWRDYRDRGLVVVAVNPGGRGGLRGLEPTDHIGGVAEYTAKMGVTYPAGLETTGNYPSFAENFRGANPFPMNIIVDREGMIRYIAREYDPIAMTDLIEGLLEGEG